MAESVIMLCASFFFPAAAIAAAVVISLCDFVRIARRQWHKLVYCLV